MERIGKEIKFFNLLEQTFCFLLICSCLAGESVHFYDEVHELGKISLDDSVRRIYMARHIIDKYIVAGMWLSDTSVHMTSFGL